MALIQIKKKSYKVDPDGKLNQSRLGRFLSSSLPAEKREQVYLVGAAIFLLVFASFQLLGSDDEVEYIQRDGGISARAYEGRGFQLSHTYTRENPKIPFLERIFCSGRRNSFFCSETNYHPYMVWWNKYAVIEDVDPNELDSGFSEIRKTFADHETNEKSSIILGLDQVNVERGSLR